MNLLVKCLTTVPVTISNKSQSEWKMYVCKVLKTNMLYIQTGEILVGIYMLAIPSATGNLQIGLNHCLRSEESGRVIMLKK